jgi:amidophosphoribosyltransferase
MKGVVGVYSKDDAAREGLHILYGVQHRGQESSGISAASNRSLRTWKGKGLVSNVFDERYDSFMHPDDYVVIGCASGESTEKNSPPLFLKSERFDVSLTFDGYVPERNNVENEEAFAKVLFQKLAKHGDVHEALYDTMRALHNAYYSLVMILQDKERERSELIAARDSRGLRPLYLALNDEKLFVSSESAPIDILENMGEVLDERRDFTPGSVVIMNDNGLIEKQVLEANPAHCAFEWVYFGRPDSTIEGRNVHDVRKRLGYALVETHNLRKLYGSEEKRSKDIVLIPVPDSGRSVCIGVAEALGMSADEGVIKNAYLGRTYIIDDPEFRKIASDLKHNIIKETVRDKKVIITDDSIVRGTVSESIAQNLLKSGAAEVEYLVSYAPIFNPCFSDPRDKILTAASFERNSLSEIGNLVADNLPSINNVRYNSPENIIKAINLKDVDICTFCISGKNPFKE